MLPWAQRVYTEIHVCICLVNWEITTRWRRELNLIAHNAPSVGFTWTIFLSDIPATKRFCLSSSGLNLTQYGTFLLVKREIHWPVEGSNWTSEPQNNPHWLFRKVQLTMCKILKHSVRLSRLYAVSLAGDNASAATQKKSVSLCSFNRTESPQDDATTTAKAENTGY